MFGSNNWSHLGLRNVEQSVYPFRLVALCKAEIASTACGTNHTISLMTHAAVAVWGRSDLGQCGVSM